MSGKKKFTLEDVRETYKKKDAWWTVLLVDPIASRLILPTANYTNITPNQLSLFSFALGLTAAYCFFLGNYTALVIGAILYHISFIIDCMDGKIARLKGTGTTFGMLLDISLDHIRVVICIAALTYSQYKLSADVTYLYLAFLFLASYCARHINALQLYKLRRNMHGKLNKAKRNLQRTGEIAGIIVEPSNGQQQKEKQEEELPEDHEGINTEILQKKKFDLQQEFKSRFTTYMKINRFFFEKRIRMHFFSGIEFQMFVFVVAPIIGYLKQFIFFGSLLLLAFEAAILYKIWLSTKDFQREFDKIKKATEEIEEKLTPEQREALAEIR